MCVGVGVGVGVGVDVGVCLAEFYYSEKGTEEASDIDIRRGTESAPLTSVSKGVLYLFN